MAELTSITPLTSLSFQSVLGDCGSELWQLMQDWLDILSATATRTTSLPSRISVRENVPSGFALRKAHASV